MKTIIPEILFEDSHIIVVKKPAGIPTQTKSFSSPDMEKILKNYLAFSARKKGENFSNPYLAVIHRLDQPVSGILTFAKDAKTASLLNRQLQNGNFGKYYLALVDNAPSVTESSLENYLIKDTRSNTSKICPSGTPGAKSARLHYRKINSDDPLWDCAGRIWNEDLSPFTLLEIHLDTGRHHQIRVQLSAAGFPIAGDTKYGGSMALDKTLKLCAYKLEFHHPFTKKLLSFSL